jgi:D-glycero-D-manno-heptose 1,7-bisphosphate phosphatase
VTPAIFLDRDGTIIRDAHFLSDPAQAELLPGAAAGLRALRDAGFRLIVVSNQSGVARGLFDEETVARVNEAIAILLGKEGATIDAWYHCPHLEDAAVAAYDVKCDCRKPAPGMILRAAREHGLDVARSYAIGDRARDVEAGIAAGCAGGVIIGGRETLAGAGVARDLVEAAGWIIARAGARVAGKE